MKKYFRYDIEITFRYCLNCKEKIVYVPYSGVSTSKLKKKDIIEVDSCMFCDGSILQY